MASPAFESIKRVSVVIVTRNNKESLVKCLQSVQKQQFPNIEKIVVDNGSSDGTTSKVQADFPEVNYNELENDRGVGAHNLGVEEASGDLVIIIADEINMPAADTVSRIVEKFRSSKDLGAAGFRLINDEKEEIDWFWGRMNGDYQSGYFSHTILAGATAIRPEIFKRMNGFWEPYYYHVADRDLATRIIGSGAEVRYFPSITLVQNRSIITRRGTRFHYLITRNMLWYIWRNYGSFRATFKTIGYLFRTFGKVLTGQSRPGPVVKGLVEGVRGLKKVFLTRKPVKRRYLPYIEGISFPLFNSEDS